MRKSLLFIIIFAIFLIVVPFIVKGVIIPDPLGDKTITEIISAIMDLLAVIGTGVAVIMIIWAGIQYMTAGGSEEKATKAKKTITWAIIGVAILWSAKFIIDAIEYILKNAGVN